MSARMSRRRFEALARQAYAGLPAAVVARLDNLDIIVQDAPGPEAEGAMDGAGDGDRHGHGGGDGERHGHGAGGSDGGGLLGLYVGVPLTERYGDGPAMPDCIYIYRRPILAMCGTAAEVAAEVRTTLWHEVGHYLGMDEQDLERLGYG